MSTVGKLRAINNALSEGRQTDTYGMMQVINRAANELEAAISRAESAERQLGTTQIQPSLESVVIMTGEMEKLKAQLSEALAHNLNLASMIVQVETVNEYLDEQLTEAESSLEEWVARATGSANRNLLLDEENSQLKEQLRWRNAKEELPPNTTPVWCRMKWHSSEKTVTFAGYYCRQYEIESTHDDECKQDYHEEKDAYFVAEGWYEEQYNWGGDWSSIAVVAGEVIEWMPVIPELVESPPTGEDDES